MEELNQNEAENEQISENNIEEQEVSNSSDKQEDNQILQIKKEALEAILKKEYKRGRKRGLIGAIIVVVVLAVFITGINVFVSLKNGSFYSKIVASNSGSLLDKKTVEKLNRIYGLIDETFIDETDKDKLREGLYKGLLESLDDVYSVYYNKDEFAEMMESADGSFEGIGAYLSQDPDTMKIEVVKPIKDSPAEKVGILAGDIIMYVDGEDISGQDLNLVVSKVRGQKGTSVNIGIVRSGEKEVLYFDIVRDKVDSISCDYEMLDNNIGYIAISEFADATDEQFEEAMDALENDGMTSLIIDLRANGGGYVDSSVAIANKLVKEGVIVTIKDRNGSGYAYEDKGDDRSLTIPCVVLVDGNTASASEILTGALKDYKLVTVIGTQTFGKGIVQDIIPLGDGSGIKLTSSKYYTPNGDNIHGVGIEPDIVVEFDGEKYVNDHEDNQLQAAINYLTYGNVEGNE